MSRTHIHLLITYLRGQIRHTEIGINTVSPLKDGKGKDND
jgi:hypothetical protein